MDPFIGEIVMFAGNFAPRGWSLCNGQLLAISSHTALFSILGTTYGGDGRTTFALPDLRGRTPIAPGTGPGLPTYRLGQVGGTERNTLTVAQMPSHNHTGTLHVSNANASQSAATANSTIATPGSSDGRSFTPTEGFNTSAPNITMNSGSVTTGNTGSSQAVNNMQPFLGMNYIIAMVGVYPSRN